MAFTVKELIEELNCYEEDKIVWFSIDNMSSPVRNIVLDEDEDDRIVLK